MIPNFTDVTGGTMTTLGVINRRCHQWLEVGLMTALSFQCECITARAGAPVRKQWTYKAVGNPTETFSVPGKQDKVHWAPCCSRLYIWGSGRAALGDFPGDQQPTWHLVWEGRSRAPTPWNLYWCLFMLWQINALKDTNKTQKIMSVYISSGL